MKKLSHRENDRWPVAFSHVLPTFALILACCSPSVRDASSMEEGERMEIQSAVINRFNEMLKYAEAGDLESLLKYFDRSSDGSYIDGATRYATFDEMAGAWRATWKVAKQDFGVPDTKVLILSSEFVLVTAVSSLTTINRDGAVFRPRLWSITTLWQLKGGQWQVHSCHQFTGEAVRAEEKQPV
ncbi:MAG TPA: DUF4440 domain-containing protein [Chryseosolibacter sp.]